MPKIKIAIEVQVNHAAIQRWLGLEGQDLLDAVSKAADSGDDVQCKVQPGAKRVRFMPLSTPPIIRGSDFLDGGSRDDR